MQVMSILNNAEILMNLQRRFDDEEIFTFVGETVLVMNPMKLIDKLYSKEMKKRYQEAAFSKGPFDYAANPPHVWAISAGAYHNLFKKMQNQAIVISGESGAGKTVNAKEATKFLTMLSNPETSLDGGSLDKPKEVGIEEKVLITYQEVSDVNLIRFLLAILSSRPSVTQRRCAMTIPHASGNTSRSSATGYRRRS